MRVVASFITPQRSFPPLAAAEDQLLEADGACCRCGYSNEMCRTCAASVHLHIFGVGLSTTEGSDAAFERPHLWSKYVACTD